MSSRTVRDAFRALVAAPGWPVPYVETVNDAPPNGSLPAAWCSVEFETITDEPISIGTPRCWRETGFLHVTVYGQAGDGDAAVMAIAEDVRDALHAWTVPPNLRVTRIDPPNDRAPSGTHGNWHELDIEVEYQLDTHR